MRTPAGCDGGDPVNAPPEGVIRGKMRLSGKVVKMMGRLEGSSCTQGLTLDLLRPLGCVVVTPFGSGRPACFTGMANFFRGLRPRTVLAVCKDSVIECPAFDWKGT